MDKKSDIEHNYSIDLIKCTALFLVVSVHALYGLGFYDMTLSFSAFPIIFTLIRQIFICCVPLFLLSTGYLCCTKQYKIDKEWGIKLLRIIIPFIITTVILIVFYRIKGIEHNPFEMLFGINKYSYAWYVEMYIGLYLLMPFINMAYSALGTKSKKRIALGIMIILTYVPSILSSDMDFSVDYWKMLYPITLYLIGGYIKEYGILISKIKLLIIMIASLSYNTFIELLASDGTTFCWNILSDYNSYLVLITSFCIFSLLLKINLTDSLKPTKRILKIISGATLSAYLISKLFDTVIYEFIISRTTDDFRHNYYYLPISILSVFLLSLLVGLPIQKISSILTEFILNRKDKIIITKKN